MCSEVQLSLTLTCYIYIAISEKLEENKITHILSIHDIAEPGDGVSSFNKRFGIYKFPL